MEKTPKNSKNLEYHLERMTRTEDFSNSRRNEQLVTDWTKQYKRKGDRYATRRCQEATMELQKQQNAKSKFEW